MNGPTKRWYKSLRSTTHARSTRALPETLWLRRPTASPFSLNFPWSNCKCELLAPLFFSQAVFLSHRGDTFNICTCLYVLFTKLYVANVVLYREATLNEEYSYFKGRKQNSAAVFRPQQVNLAAAELEALRLTPNPSLTGQVWETAEVRRKSVGKQGWKRHHLPACCATRQRATWGLISIRSDPAPHGCVGSFSPSVWPYFPQL